MNVTLRSVERDDDTFPRYADRDLIAVVMLFDVELTPAADHRVQDVTRELVEAALTCGGRYYLPYRSGAKPLAPRTAAPRPRKRP